MKITSADFIKSAVSKATIPNKDNTPEVAFVGRSNVGKSSLINYLLNRKGLAKTSSTPGKTRLLNYFLINKNFYCVDLPGYGYAVSSKKDQETWKKFIEEYFDENQNLKLVVQLIDIRHELKDSDQLMLEFIQYFEIPFIIALTKADKLGANDLVKQTKYFKDLFPEIPIIVSSAEKGKGKDAILSEINKATTV